MTHICQDERHHGRPATCFVPRWVFSTTEMCSHPNEPWFYKCDECRAELEATGWYLEPIPESEE